MTLLAFAVLLFASAPADRVVLDDRPPALILVVTPPGSRSTLGTSQVVRTMSEILTEAAGLKSLSLEQAGIDFERLMQCDREDRYSCWVNIARGRARFRYLFVVFVQPVQRDTDRVSAMMLDSDAVLALLQKPRAPGETSREMIEDEVFSSAVRTEPVNISAGDLGALRDRLQRWVSQDFSVAGERDPGGVVQIALSCRGCSLSFDNTPIATLGDKPLEISGVAAGPHTIAAGKATCTIEVVLPNATIVDDAKCPQLALDLEIASTPRADLRVPHMIGGAVAAAAGVFVLVWAAERAGSGPGSLCLLRANADESGCETLGFSGSSSSERPLPTAELEGLNGGIPLAPLGLALFTGGAGVSLTALFTDDELWWAPVAIGLVTGIAAYGITAAIGGG